MRSASRKFGLALIALLGLAVAPAMAADPTNGEIKQMLDTVWVMITAFLVFFMNLGFGCVEAGFCRAKNATNILGKNFIVFAFASLAYWVVGWNVMFHDGTPYYGKPALFVSGADGSPSTTRLGNAIKDDIAAQFKLDDEAKKKLFEDEKFVEKINEIQSEAEGKVTKADEKFKVSLEVPGHEKFEKEYEGKDFYYGVYSSISWTGVPLLAKFFFQLVFAGTAATIVSGCVAERIHYGSFMLFSIFITAVSYPITGHWIWGGGWLAAEGFWDFAGSTVVHTVGGAAGLAGILLLGPRLGKYRPDGKVQAIPGHSMALGFIGGLVLWFGWFGFNPGSTMGVAINDIARITVVTNIACATGMIAATVLAWIIMGKPDFSMTVNGALAGLVAITAPCAWVSLPSAAIIGVLGGILAVFAVIFFDKIKIDDPVGALAVHLGNGIFGTLCVGLFADPAVGYDAALGPKLGLLVGGTPEQLLIQAKGVGAVFAFTFVLNFVAWAIIKAIFGIRVHTEAEVIGLDVTEMGMEAYNGFQVTDPHDHLVAEPKSSKTPAGGDKRFTVVVDGPAATELVEAWSNMCMPNGGKTGAEFKAVYPHMTTVRGNKFTFRSGDPKVMKEKLELLFQSKFKSPIKTSIE